MPSERPTNARNRSLFTFVSAAETLAKGNQYWDRGAVESLFVRAIMRSLLRVILVEDASGARFVIYEFSQREFLFGYRRNRTCFELDTGDIAERADAETFRLTRTGEILMRISQLERFVGIAAPNCPMRG